MAATQPTPEDIAWRDGLTGLTQPKLNDALCDAVDAASIWRVEQALAAGADARASGNQPLRKAAVKGQLRIAKMLLDAGADLQVNDAEPLAWAARAGDCALVEFFLSRGECEKGWGGRRAKGWAMDYKQAACVSLIDDAAGIRARRAKNGRSLAEELAGLIDAGTVPVEDIRKGTLRGEICLNLLCNEKKLDMAFAPEHWFGKKDEMIGLWKKLPKRYQDDVDLPGKVAALGAHTLKTNKPPKLKLKPPAP